MVANASNTDGLTTKEWLQRIDGKLDELAKCTQDLTVQAARNRDRISSHDGDLSRHESLIKGLDDKMDEAFISIREDSNRFDKLLAGAVALGTLVGSWFGVGNK